MPDSDDLAEAQLKEAYALPDEANKTSAQAREAVRQVRQAREICPIETSASRQLDPLPKTSKTACFDGT